MRKKKLLSLTDQNSRITRRLVFRMNLDAAGEYRPSLRTAEKTVLKAETSSGGLLEEWEVETERDSGTGTSSATLNTKKRTISKPWVITENMERQSCRIRL